QLRAVIRTHTPEIEPVLAGAAIPAGASPDLLARTIQAQGMWFQLLSIAEQNAAMRQRRQSEVERGYEQLRGTFAQVVTAAATAAQELAWGLYFVNENLFDVVPELQEKLERALHHAYPDERWEVGPFFQCGSWIGGDRDGNPFVTNQVTRECFHENRLASLRRYRQRLQDLLRGLSVTDRAAPVTESFRRALGQRLAESGEGERIAARNPG